MNEEEEDLIMYVGNTWDTTSSKHYVFFESFTYNFATEHFYFLV